MWFSIISSIVFLAITVLLFTPELRKFPIYRSLAFFFLFEGIYILSSYVVTEMWPRFYYMSTIHDIGCVVLGSYILITLYNYRERNEASKNTHKTSPKIETTNPEVSISNTAKKPVSATAKKVTTAKARKTTTTRTTKKSTRSKTGKTSSAKTAKKPVSTKAN